MEQCSTTCVLIVGGIGGVPAWIRGGGLLGGEGSYSGGWCSTKRRWV
jgi:hypothetical protein